MKTMRALFPFRTLVLLTAFSLSLRGVSRGQAPDYPRRINGTFLAVQGDVQSYQISANDSAVIYLAIQDRSNMVDLYVWKAQAIWTSSGGDWSAALNWRNSTPPDGTVLAVIATPAIIRIASGTTPTVAKSLVTLFWPQRQGLRASSLLSSVCASLLE